MLLHHHDLDHDLILLRRGFLRAGHGSRRGGDLLLLDTKVGSPYVASLTVEERSRAAHVAFAGTAERHVTAVLGRAQRGEPGDGPHDFATGAGYVSVKKADYHGALQRAVEVRPLIHETYGGFYRTSSRTLREMAGVDAARQAPARPAAGVRARSAASTASASRVRWPRGSPSSSATACGSSARVASPAAARERAPPAAHPGRAAA